MIDGVIAIPDNLYAKIFDDLLLVRLKKCVLVIFSENTSLLSDKFEMLVQYFYLN